MNNNENSKIINNFINYLSKKIKFKNSSNDLKTSNRLKYLYNLIQSEYLNVQKNIKKEIKIFDEEQKIKNMNELDTNYFISKENKIGIDELNKLYCVNYIDEITKKSIKMYCYFKNKIENKLLDKLAIQIITILNLFSFHHNNVIMNLYYLEKKKEIKKDNIINMDCVNSGSTYQNSGEFTVWRKEEFMKVAIHELIHSIYLDHQYINKNEVNKLLSNICVNKNKIHLQPNESFVEMNARLLYLIFSNLMNKKDYNVFLKMIYNEQIWSLVQSIKILNHYKFNSIEDFLDNKKCSYYFEQESCVYSYYLVVASFLQNLSKYLDFLEKHHIDFFILKNIEQREKRGIDLIKLIQETLSTKIYKKNINLLFENKDIILNNKNKLISKSLKMISIL